MRRSCSGKRDNLFFWSCPRAIHGLAASVAHISSQSLRANNMPVGESKRSPRQSSHRKGRLVRPCPSARLVCPSALRARTRRPPFCRRTHARAGSMVAERVMTIEHFFALRWDVFRRFVGGSVGDGCAYLAPTNISQKYERHDWRLYGSTGWLDRGWYGDCPEFPATSLILRTSENCSRVKPTLCPFGAGHGRPA